MTDIDAIRQKWDFYDARLREGDGDGSLVGAAFLIARSGVADVRTLLAEVERARLNTRRMALLAEAYIYEPQRITQGGLIAQIQRALTDQDVEYEGRAEEGQALPTPNPTEL